MSLFLAAALFATAIPVIGQESPKSILPPGFGEQDAPKPAPAPTPTPSGPDEPSSSGGESPSVSTPSSGSRSSGSRPSAYRPSSGGGSSIAGGTTTGPDGQPLGEDEIDISQVLPDLPPSQRRSIAQIGAIGPDDGDLGPDAYGAAKGLWLAHLMDHMKAPIASRWASIALRRSLLSQVKTPADINGADFAASRAWLLLRMGEAQAGRQLVQAVDADQGTDKLRDAGLQAALATADPAAMCPMVDYLSGERGKETRWRMAKAVCFALVSEPAQASALIDSVQDSGKVPEIDVVLAEKVIGAGSNSRRSVNILWENVNSLTSWRIGMANATNVAIPDNLLKTAGPQVRAWRASAALLSPSQRLPDADMAAALGVFSSTALVQAYADAFDLAVQGDSGAANALLLRDAYAAPSNEARLTAMTKFWSANDPVTRYARLIATARAANEIQADSDSKNQADSIVASMLSAGLDVQAVRWAKVAGNGSLGQGLLAVGSPSTVINYTASDVTGFGTGDSGKRAQFLLAGLAGLGRLSPTEATAAAEKLEVPLGREDAWTRALDTAVAGSERGTVVLLAALGLEGTSWSQVPADHLYRAVSALRRVGMEGEARMIAAEALMRS